MPIVCGIHPVLEALAAGSRTIERVVVTKGVRNKRILEVIKKASERGVPLRFEPREALDRASDGERHQGVLALVADKGLLSLEELQKSARTPALLMLLDGVEDPRNLGAIIRSVDAAGADGVILPDRHTASLSDAASRTAAGALESVKIARIGNVVQALESLKAKGFWIIGFDGSGKERWDAIDYKRPVVLVLGGEGKGIRRLVKEHCDHIVSLPVFGQVSSLNVSVAAGIALYEAVRQRGTVPTMARPIPPRALAAKKPVVIGPPPEDREEDPGARRRAAAIASLAAAASLASAGGVAESPAGTSTAATAAPAAEERDEDVESPVAEASLEAIETDDEANAAGQARASRAADLQDEDRDVEDDGEEDDDVDDDDLPDDDRPDDADEDDGEDEDDGDDEGNDDDGDEDDDDDDEEDGDEEEEQPDGTELAAPFMPEDNSGGGEVTWGSEKELHAHRPRREGERRFGGNGARRSGGVKNGKKKRPVPGGGAPRPDGPPGARSQGAGPAQGGQGPAREHNRNQNRQGRDQHRRPQNAEGGRPQGEPGPDRPVEGERPPQDTGEGAGVPQDHNGERRPDQGSEAGRPQGEGKKRNRRRRGGRGRSGSRGPVDPNAPRNAGGGAPEGQPNRGEGGGESGAATPQAGDGPPSGERPQDGGGGEAGQAQRRDRENRRRRRRRGRRGPGGPAGGGGSAPSGGDSGGSSSGGPSSGSDGGA